VQVAGERAHDGELLGVLLAEDGDVGAHEAEERGDHRRHALEVAGPAVALEAGRRALDPHSRRGAGRVDGGDLGQEDEIAAGRGEARRIALLVARIALEVGRVVELRRVDENRDDDARSVLPRQLDQRQVAVVERAHGRHEADPFAGGAPLADGVPQLLLTARPDHAP
jgi:hypothetical protein